MTKDCSVHENYKLRTCCVHKLFFVLTFRTIYVNTRIRDSNKDLPVTKGTEVLSYMKGRYKDITSLTKAFFNSPNEIKMLASLIEKGHYSRIM